MKAALAQAQALIQSALHAHDSSARGPHLGPAQPMRTEDAFRAALDHWRSQPRRTSPELCYVDLGARYSCRYGGAWPTQEWLLEQGAPVRVLTVATGDGQGCPIGCLESSVRHGAQVRVSMRPLPGFAVLNRTAAILPAAHRDTSRSVLVREPHTVHSLRVLFDAVFSRAADWTIAMRFRSMDGDPEEETLLEVLHLMGTGRTDEVAARELGMSVRTYRRHVSEVMQRLDASSRFQAGLRAAELGLTSGTSTAAEPPAGRGRATAPGVPRQNGLS
ncbi:LuxR C-terminal-related transcriptional regulator [Streptomyces sp. G1]|uniref:helix-turn-helix transcriptional regulator n=1 Tax=Streptomyces sp. G1 TaxID=361572 RepID=UPI00202FA68E|nr:LuxR C-terminal-related transcriptional regulator [Streptomyces sp. G1]MCM1975116.1 LuxR C-terminal-related transcriptional regulator [Streptomyces sp. G1]